MDDILARYAQNLVGRIHGPMNFRLALQPLMAVVLAIRDGTRDAHRANAPYLRELLVDPNRRRHLIANGLKSIGKVFIVALILDGVYQYIELRWFYPGEAVSIAVLLALVPYILLRGPVSRLVAHRRNVAAHGRQHR